MSDEAAKIIVDSDWKQEAQREKDRLAQEAAEHSLPEEGVVGPSFYEVVNMIAMQAVIGLGGLRTPDGRQIPPDMNVAKHHIDMLEILQQKTKGNLDEQEEKILNTSLHELRLAFVQMAKAIADAVSAEAGKPAQA